MRTISLLLLLVLIFSCSKKEVKVPKIALNSVEEITNYSQIWMFNNKGKLDLNERNRISSTHWIFNIDKHLQLKEILPEIIRLRIKHNEKSPHNTQKMDNYYSYINSLNDKLSLYQFDSIQYKFINTNKIPVYKKESDTILIKITASNLDFNVVREDSLTIIQTAFVANISFQNYLYIKAKLERSLNKRQISSLEYIINE